MRLNRLPLLALLAARAFAQTNPAALAAHEWRLQHERSILDEFTSLLAIPNIPADPAGLQRNADTLVRMLQQRGVNSRLVTAEGAVPVVYGELPAPGATRTIVFYAHYDGQPLDPKEWSTPPFTPTFRPADTVGPESRLYARSASDDKAPIIAILTALDALKAAGLHTRANLRFVFEGEEEASSVNLQKILALNKEIFTADLWLICDGPLSPTRRPTIIFGARGNTTLDITTYGPRNELHSGHYGNWAPNPAMSLVRLLATMKDDAGHVLIPGFYDGVAPLSALEKRAVAESPDVDADLMRDFWLGGTEGSTKDAAPKKLAELITTPALNIRGMASSRTGSLASNVIPSTATVSLDVRLVKGMDHNQTVRHIIDHIRKQGFFVTDKEPGEDVRRAHAKVAWVTVKPGGYDGTRTPMDLPISQEVIRVVESVRGPAVKVPNEGGSVPLDMIERTLGTRTIDIPIANHDNNQHSFNENLRIQNLWDGIELMAALLTM